MENTSENPRRIENLIRAGSISAVDHAKARCRVITGELETDFLPFFTRRAGTTNEWDPVSVGEQCLVLSPGGDPATGFVLAGIYSDENPQESNDPELHRMRWGNGDTLTHHAGTGHTELRCTSLTILCSERVRIFGSRIDLNEDKD